jgi:hypothetical protein
MTRTVVNRHAISERTLRIAHGVRAVIARPTVNTFALVQADTNRVESAAGIAERDVTIRTRPSRLATACPGRGTGLPSGTGWFAERFIAQGSTPTRMAGALIHAAAVTVDAVGFAGVFHAAIAAPAVIAGANVGPSTDRVVSAARNTNGLATVFAEPSARTAAVPRRRTHFPVCTGGLADGLCTISTCPTRITLAIVRRNAGTMETRWVAVLRRTRWPTEARQTSADVGSNTVSIVSTRR